MDYLKSLNNRWNRDHVNKYWYGIVFDGHKFVSFVLRGNVVVKAYECLWTSKGSKEFFVEFIEKSLDNWTKCLNRMCFTLGLTVPLPEIGESMFLGKGAFVRVVKKFLIPTEDQKL